MMREAPMATANVDGLNIVHEIVGNSGPVVAVMPGGRRGYLEMRPFAEKIAAKGFRVLLHDRRNTGGSDLRFDDRATEEVVWADDLNRLLGQLGLLPAYVSGSSSGARTAINFALQHPDGLKGLILMRVTGGAFAASRLPQNYYRVFIEAAQTGGMEAVCATDRYGEYIANNPAVRGRLLAMDPREFIRVQKSLLDQFLAGASLPVMGTSEAQLGSIRVPTLVIPGNDNTHSSVSGLAAHRMIAGSRLHRLPVTDQDVDLLSWDEWAPYHDEIVEAYAAFINEVEAG
jgi:pimeloyl-ACP methyl ester carboxylesterase